MKILSLSILFLLSMSIYSQSYEWMLENDTSEVFQKEMAKALKMKPNKLKRNYYIASYAYNKSISLLFNMDYRGVSLEEVEVLQAEVLKYRDIVKEHLDKVEDSSFREIDQLVMKYFIYFAVNDTENASTYKNKLVEMGEETLLMKPIEAYSLI